MSELTNSRGYTLSELIISAAIACFVGLVIAVLMSFLSGRFVDVSERLEAEITAARAENLFRTYLANAIDINMTAAPQAGESFTIASQEGWIRDNINYDQISDMTTDWSTLAVFWREDGRPESGTPMAYGGLPRKTTIWYRRPSLTTSGVIFFDPGPDPVTAPGNTMTPTYQDPYVDRITFLTVDKNLSTPEFDKVGSVDVQLRVRYHPTHLAGRNWCPDLDITANANGCGAITAVHKDIEKTFRVILHNNLLKWGGYRTSSSPTVNEIRVMGNIYFFKLVNPIQ